MAILVNIDERLHLIRRLMIGFRDKVSHDTSRRQILTTKVDPQTE